MANDLQFVQDLAAALSKLAGRHPVGEEWVSTLGVVPTGGLQYDGLEKSRTLYADAWEWANTNGLVIPEAEWQASSTLQKTKFSSGDGSTTFRMPLNTDEVRGIYAISLISETCDVDTEQILSEIQGYIKATGSRGTLAGYQSTGTATTISATSADTNVTSGDVTIANGASGTAWTKAVRLTAETPSVTLGDAWNWLGGDAPTLEKNGVLFCFWCGTLGLAKFVSQGAV